MKIPSLVEKAPVVKSPSAGTTSVNDVIIEEGRLRTAERTIRNFPDVLQDQAERAVIDAAAEDAQAGLEEYGVDSESASQIVNVARNGSKAVDSIVGLGAKAIDKGLGTDIAGALDDLLPQRRPSSTEPAPAGLGGPSKNSVLSKMRLRADPQFNFNWRVFLPEIRGTDGVSGFDGSVLEVFNYYVEDVHISLPFFTAQDYFRNGTRVYYPTYSDTGTINITFYEDGNMNTTRYIEAWKNLIQNRVTGLYNFPSAYKKQITVVTLDNMNVVGGFFLVDGAFPTQSQPIHFGSASSDIVRINQEFAVNRIYFVPNEDRYEEVDAARAGLQKVNAQGPQGRTSQLAELARGPVQYGRRILGLDK